MVGMSSPDLGIGLRNNVEADKVFVVPVAKNAEEAAASLMNVRRE